MKKIIALLLVLTMVLAFAGCAKTEAPAETLVETAPATTAAPETEAVTEAATEAPAEAAAPMTHEEYMAAEVESPVSIVTYVQNHQSWWDNKITVYAQSPDGAYFLYNMTCSEEDAAKLVPGTKIAVEGFKTEWSGEVEVAEGAAFTFVDDGETFIAEALDVTELLSSEELIAHQNEFVAFTGMTIEACNDEGAAFQYNWDGSGEDGNDLYFKASVGGATYTFVVESYLTGAGTEVYEAVKALEVGQTVNMEGFLYWYEGAQPHVTSIAVAE